MQKTMLCIYYSSASHKITAVYAGFITIYKKGGFVKINKVIGRYHYSPNGLDAVTTKQTTHNQFHQIMKQQFLTD
jgi:hypothetical protein